MRENRRQYPGGFRVYPKPYTLKRPLLCGSRQPGSCAPRCTRAGHSSRGPCVAAPTRCSWRLRWTSEPPPPAPAQHMDNRGVSSVSGGRPELLPRRIRVMVGGCCRRCAPGRGSGGAEEGPKRARGPRRRRPASRSAAPWGGARPGGDARKHRDVNRDASQHGTHQGHGGAAGRSSSAPRGRAGG